MQRQFVTCEGRFLVEISGVDGDQMPKETCLAGLALMVMFMVVV